MAPLWALLGSLQSESKQYEEAKHSYQKAIDLDASLSAAYSGLGIVLRSLDKYTEAEQMIKKSILLKPTAARYVILGDVQELLELAGEAEQSYKQALVLDPTCEEAYYNLAVLYSYDNDKADDAIKLFREAIRIDPNYSRAYTELGGMLCGQRLYEEAEKMLCKAIELDGAQVWSYVYLANTQWQLGRVSEAEKTYIKACEIAPTWALPRWSLATLLLESNRIAEAEEYFRKAVAVEDDAEAAYHLGRFLCEKGEYDEAIKWINVALRLEPQHCDAKSLASYCGIPLKSTDLNS